MFVGVVLQRFHLSQEFDLLYSILVSGIQHDLNSHGTAHVRVHIVVCPAHRYIRTETFNGIGLDLNQGVAKDGDNNQYNKYSQNSLGVL